jgi:hypothetical protein
VREAEDLVSRELEVSQHRRRAAKVAGHVHPAPVEWVESRHRETVSQARQLVADTVWSGGVHPVADEWSPPPALGELRDLSRAAARVLYPLDVSTGEHGLLIDACAGSAALARTSSDPEAIRYVVDLGALAGVRLTFGDYSSPATEVQETLF